MYLVLSFLIKFSLLFRRKEKKKKKIYVKTNKNHKRLEGSDVCCCGGNSFRGGGGGGGAKLEGGGSWWLQQYRVAAWRWWWCGNAKYGEGGGGGSVKEGDRGGGTMGEVGGWHRVVGSRGIDLICKLVLTFTKCKPIVRILVYFWLTTRTYPIRLTILGCNKYIGQYKWDIYVLFHIILSIFLFPFFSLQCDCLILS